MSDTNTTPQATPAGPPGTPTPPSGGGRRHRRRRWLAAGLAVLIGLVGFGLGRATGHWSHWRAGGFGMHATIDAEALGRRVDFGVGRMLAHVDGTPDQKAKVAEIAKAALKELLPLRARLTEAREKWASALKAQVLDRAAIEQLRTEQLTLMDTASKRAAQAVTDAAEVLSPAQRAKLVERWQSRSRRG